MVQATILQRFSQGCLRVLTTWWCKSTDTKQCAAKKLDVFSVLSPFWGVTLHQDHHKETTEMCQHMELTETCHPVQFTLVKENQASRWKGGLAKNWCLGLAATTTHLEGFLL